MFVNYILYILNYVKLLSNLFGFFLAIENETMAQEQNSLPSNKFDNKDYIHFTKVCNHFFANSLKNNTNEITKKILNKLNFDENIVKFWTLGHLITCT